MSNIYAYIYTWVDGCLTGKYKNNNNNKRILFYELRGIEGADFPYLSNIHAI